MQKRFSEVAQSALNITQINESEVVDWSRKVGMGSSAMRSIWDTIITHEDSFQIYSFTFTGTEPVELPGNLYTIRDVVDRNGDSLRRTEGFTLLGSHEYRIVNTSIQTGGQGPTTVIYTQRPPDLTMNIPPAYVSRDVLKLNHQYLGQSTGHIIILIDLERDEEVFRYEIESLAVSKWDVTVDGNIILLSGNELLIYDGRVEDPFIFQASGVKDFFLDSSNYAVYLTGDDEVFEVDYNLDSLTASRPFAPKWTNLYVRLNGSTIQYTIMGGVIDGDESGGWINYQDDVEELIADKNGKYIYYTVGGQQFAASATRTWIPEMKNVKEISSKAERGEGFNCIVYQARKYSINNIYPDTILDYPNTAYFDLLEAKMAEELMVQLRQDVSDIRAIRVEREATLLSMLSRNKADSFRIKNRYRAGQRHNVLG